eukprot:m.158760 g.158760  ORF g.158760 m.158760 type:complete len:155 (+) comp13358_c0_seq6:831-1295(+)
MVSKDRQELQEEQQRHQHSRPGTLVHLVQAADTLNGLAIKYETTREAIMQLNNITSELQLFARKSVIVEKPHDYVEEEGAQEPIPMDVMMALKKRTMTNKLVYSHSLTREEVSILSFSRCCVVGVITYTFVALRAIHGFFSWSNVNHLCLTIFF